MRAKTKGQKKIAKTMTEFKKGTLHSGSKKGPKVTSKKQAVAIGISKAQKAGAKVSKKGKKFNAAAYDRARKNHFKIA